MLQPSQDQALRDLAHSVRLCLESLGVDCTAHLLGALAIDLHQAVESDEEWTFSPTSEPVPA